MNVHEKSIERMWHSRIMLGMFIVTVVGTFSMIYLGKLTNESWLAIGAILGYLGNHTYQNYKTTPKDS